MLADVFRRYLTEAEQEAETTIRIDNAAVAAAAADPPNKDEQIELFVASYLKRAVATHARASLVARTRQIASACRDFRADGLANLIQDLGSNGAIVGSKCQKGFSVWSKALWCFSTKCNST